VPEPQIDRFEIRNAMDSMPTTCSLPTAEADAAPVLPWLIDEIDLSLIDRSIAADRRWFYILSTASMIETGSDLYARNLEAYYASDPETARWLIRSWQHEECQHGAALRRYVETVWPEFDWDLAYRRFFTEYEPLAAPSGFKPTLGLELAARCSVETGTSAYYRMLYELAPEPQLRRILNNIRSDEVRHYKHFLRFFKIHQRDERQPRWAVAQALASRLLETRQGDGWVAYRHVFEVCNPGRTCTWQDYRAFVAEVRGMAERAFPFKMATEMLVAPLALPARLRAAMHWGVELVLRRFAFSP
jgi:hypothetical protein